MPFHKDPKPISDDKHSSSQKHKDVHILVLGTPGVGKSGKNH